MVLNCHVGAVLGTEPGPSTRAISALNHSPVPEPSSFYGFVLGIPICLSFLNIFLGYYMDYVIGACWIFSIKPVSDSRTESLSDILLCLWCHPSYAISIK